MTTKELLALRKKIEDGSASEKEVELFLNQLNGMVKEASELLTEAAQTI